MVGFFNFNSTMEKIEKKNKEEFNLISHSSSASSSPSPLSLRNTTLALAESLSQMSHTKLETIFL